MLPPSAVHTSAEDDIDDAVNRSNRVQGNNTLASNGRSSTVPVPRISSLPAGVNGSGTSAAPAGASAQDTQQQQQEEDAAAAADAERDHPVQENPLNVMLAARAHQIGDDPEAIRQQLLAMKLASGALQFNNAVSTMATFMPGSAGSEAASRFASFSGVQPGSSRSTIGTRPGGVAGAPAAASPAAVTPPIAAATSAGAATSVSVAETAAVVAAADDDSRDAGVASPFAASSEQHRADTPSPEPLPAVDDDDIPTPLPQQQQGHLSPSPSLFNVTAANVITQQPSQSLQRLLSGQVRPRRAASSAVSWQQSTSVPSPQAISPAPTHTSEALQARGSSLASSPSPAPAVSGAAAGGGQGAANGELPIVQQAPAGACAMMISEDDAGGDEDGTCEICFDAEAVVALQMCGHTLCVGCCKELCKLHHFKPGLCPYCR